LLDRRCRRVSAALSGSDVERADRDLLHANGPGAGRRLLDASQIAGGTERKSVQVAILASRIAVGVGAIAVAVLVRISLDPLLQGRNT
jgi:hypothetical protein